MRLLHKLMNRGDERAVKLRNAQQRISSAARSGSTTLAEAQKNADTITHYSGIIEAELAKGDRPSSRF